MAKKKKQQKPWQYTFSFGLSLVMLLLVVGYFVQSFIEIREVKPIRVAIERIGERVGEQNKDSLVGAKGEGEQAGQDE
jgi:hypothetical protein